MSDFKFYIVDVFSVKKYSGNQLAVFISADGLSDIKMQEIALEMNFPETTFIINSDNSSNEFEVRIFTPYTELPFAGHPVLGTAYVIKNHVLKEEINTIKLNLKSGIIPVNFDKENNTSWMKQNTPDFFETVNKNEIAEILNINYNDIHDKFPVQIVSTGLPFFIIPIKKLETVKNIKLNLDKYYKFIKNYKAKTIYVFCCETYKKENDINTRMFAPEYGILEDPATGSAVGCLSAYLLYHNFFNRNNIKLRVEQGYEIKRPSLLMIDSEKMNNEYIINIGGKVESIAECKLI